jgi:hypothetical protein
MLGNFRVAVQLAPSQEGFSPMELFNSAVVFVRESAGLNQHGTISKKLQFLPTTSKVHYYNKYT